MKKKNQHRINEDITVPQVRLVGEDVTAGVYNTSDALRMAQDKGEDLVEVSPNANPPVCKIIEYNKFLYEIKRKDKEQKKKQKESIVETKEIRVTPDIGQHDIDFKLRHAEKFLKDNNKVRFVLFFSGREIVHSDRGQKVLLEIAEKLSEFGVAEALPVMENKKLFMVIKPKK